MRSRHRRYRGPMTLLLIVLLLPSAGCVPENLLFNLYASVGTALFSDLAGLTAASLGNILVDGLNLDRDLFEPVVQDQQITIEQPAAEGG